MRAKGMIAVAVVMAAAGAGWARAEAPIAADLIETPAAARGLLAMLDQPGLRLSRSFRLRIDADDRDFVLRGDHVLSPNQLMDRPRQRRLSSMLDYFPVRDSGLFLSAGMRHAPKRARWTPGALSTIDIFMPKMTSPLRARSNVARNWPMAVAGWAGMVGPEASLSLSAGAIQEHGQGMKASSASIAGMRPTLGAWSRVGGLAQVSFGMRF